MKPNQGGDVRTWTPEFRTVEQLCSQTGWTDLIRQVVDDAHAKQGLDRAELARQIGFVDLDGNPQPRRVGNLFNTDTERGTASRRNMTVLELIATTRVTEDARLINLALEMCGYAPAVPLPESGMLNGSIEDELVETLEADAQALRATDLTKPANRLEVMEVGRRLMALGSRLMGEAMYAEKR